MGSDFPGGFTALSALLQDKEKKEKTDRKIK